MKRPLLLGLETEYGFTPLAPDGRVLDRDRVAAELLEQVRARVAHLPDAEGSGIFLGNGSRLYIDRGCHPEVSTPECSDPGEVVRHARAGEALLADAARELEERRPGSRILLFACNMDYGGTRQTWGCHESYLYGSDFPRMEQELVPHLVSRLLYTGGGGFDNLGAGLEFLVSPRVCQIHGTSPSERCLLSKPREPLCVGYGRLHVVCGESQRSAIGNWLRLGVTALIVRLIDAGHRPGEAVALAQPLAAMRVFAADPACRRKVKLADGRQMGALAIQEHYLAAVEEQVGKPFMPAWAADVCRGWRVMLERLREAPGSVATTLDWAIKHAIFEQHLATRAAQGVAPDTLQEQLYELDTRFGELGEQGLFAQLSRAGALSASADAVGGLEPVLESAPPVGRAALRGELVRRLSGRGSRYLCDWEGVIDRERGVFADLRDPYATEIRWRPIAEGSREWREDGLVQRVLERRELPRRLTWTPPTSRPASASQGRGAEALHPVEAGGQGDGGRSLRDHRPPRALRPGG